MLYYEKADADTVGNDPSISLADSAPYTGILPSRRGIGNGKISAV